ncbi:hypothetical protein FKP32DRAFT_1597686 [Trametes sanguinea]|nr:hypothetical protein FKP32DRAFT_1597686 [Trametes sanguinea]
MAGSLFQHSYYIVNNLNAILYGVVLVLYFRILRFMYNSRKRTFMDKFMVIFSTVLVALNTIFWTTQTYFGEMMWITHADYPGGSDQYWADYGSVWYQIWGMAACVVCNLMNDALLTYRCYVIWGSRRVITLPCILWIASLAFAIGLLFESGRPHGNYFMGIATIFVTAYTASTFAFNVIVTGLIVGRIVAVGRRLGYSQDFRVYTGAVALVVESALPFTVFSAVYLVTYAMGSNISMAFSFYAMFTCISPLLITLRVLSRRAWTRDSCTLFTTTISCGGHADFLATGLAPDESAQKKAWDLEAAQSDAAAGGIVRAVTVDISPAGDVEHKT